MSKKCSKCGGGGPFHKDKSKKDGLTCQCAKCRAAKKSEWEKRNPDKKAEYARQYYLRNQEKIKEAAAAHQRNNLDKFREYNRRYREKYPDRQKSRLRAWYENNKDKVRAKKQKRRAIKEGNGGSYTPKEWKSLCAQYDNRCLACGKKKKLSPDHVIPLVKGGSSDISNIQPLCISCNKKKHTKTTDYRTEPFFKRWIQDKLL